MISELSKPMCEDLQERLTSTRIKIMELQKLKSNLLLQLEKFKC